MSDRNCKIDVFLIIVKKSVRSYLETQAEMFTTIAEVFVKCVLVKRTLIRQGHDKLLASSPVAIYVKFIFRRID